MSNTRAERSAEMATIRQKLLKRESTVAVEDIELKAQELRTAKSRIIWKSFSMYVPTTEFSKADKEKRLVKWIASSEAIDSYGDIVRFDAMKEAFADYMKFGNIREMHWPSAVGTVKDYELDAKSKTTSITSKIVDDNAWNKVIEGVYKWYSIWGKVLEAEPLMIKTTDESWNEYEIRSWGLDILKIELIEISLVDRPACPEALIESYKARNWDKSWFVPDIAFVSKDLAKSEPQSSDSIVKSILSVKSQNAMFEKVRNNLVAFFKSQDDVDLEAMSNDEGNVTLTKSQLYSLTKQFVEKAVSEVEATKSDEVPADATPSETPEVTPEGWETPSDTPEATPEVTPEVTPEATPEPEAEKSVDVSEIVTKAVDTAIVKAVSQIQEFVKWQIDSQNEKIEKAVELTKNNETNMKNMLKWAWFSVQKDTDGPSDRNSVFKGILA